MHDRILSKNPLEDLTAMQIDIYNSLPGEGKRIDVLPLFEVKGFKGGTIGRFLGNKELFTRVDTKGHYRKRL